MSSRALITTKSVGLRFGNRQVLHDIDFTIAAGEIVTIVGPNGSGKSSFLKCLTGAVRPTTGSITHCEGLVIGYVPQKLHLDPVFPMTVARFLRLASRDTAEIESVSNRLSLATLMASQIADLSGGQLQRVLLAHALMGKPDLLVLDEAAQGLDQPAAARFYRLIEDVRRDLDCAVLMVSHDLHVVMSASDRVICLNGHICCEGAPTIVSEAPEYRQLFGYGTEGALALYRHVHDHAHGENEHEHDHAG